jgi:hypothetical protein
MFDDVMNYSSVNSSISFTLLLKTLFYANMMDNLFTEVLRAVNNSLCFPLMNQHKMPKQVRTTGLHSFSPKGV